MSWLFALFGGLFAVGGLASGGSSKSAAAPVGPVETDPIDLSTLDPEPDPESEPEVDAGDPPTPVALEATAGRVTHLRVEDHETAQSVRILEGPEHGNVTVNPDNTLAVVLNDAEYTGETAFRYEVTHGDGSVEEFDATLHIESGSQEAGWGEGHHYILETDENDDIIVETGNDHRKVYLSEDEDALSRADIAALEGLNESDITQEWLIENGTYGADEEMALQTEVGMDLWYGVTGEQAGPNSNWLLFEKGFEYEDLGRLVSRGMNGEDELHPAHITSWGEGEDPVIASQIFIYQKDSENIVFSDVHLQGGVRALIGSNMIFDDVEVSKNGLGFIETDTVTIRNSNLHDIYRDAPEDGEDWHPHTNRFAGVFSDKSEGILIENTLIAQVGWEEGYDPDGDGNLPQPPSQFSQNAYFTDSAEDFTFRDNVSTHAASWGLQARGGGFIEDNLFSENNAGFYVAGGNFDSDEFTGNYTLANGNVVTSAAYKVAYQIGGLSLGITNDGKDSTLLDNIVTHLADPNDPEDIALKVFNNGGLIHNQTPGFDNTIQYNWAGNRDDANNADINADGLDPTLLDQKTLATLAQSVLGDPNADGDDLADYLKENEFDTDSLLAHFKEAFETANEASADGTTHGFVPNVLGGGVRWDNRLNWDSGTTPGEDSGDSVALNGNWVTYAANTTVQDLSLGDGGALKLVAGKLTVEGTTSVDTLPETGAAELNIESAGQFWTNGIASDDTVDVTVTAGRFANTGEIKGNVSFDVQGGDVILATGGASTTFGAGDALNISGTEADVGFDGDDDGTAVLRFSEGSKLSFTADEDGFEMIEEFRSGAFGDDGPDVQSGINLGQGDLQIDLTELAGGSSEHILIEVDEIIGRIYSINLVGMSTTQSAEITLDYESDQLLLNLSEYTSADAAFTFVKIGQESAGLDGTVLWDKLTENVGSPEGNIHRTHLYVNNNLVQYNTAPIAADDYAITDEDTAVRIDLLGNDSDLDNDELIVTLGNPTKGSVFYDGQDFYYTPDLDFNGTDSFSYRVDDAFGGTDTANVSVTVNPSNDAPTATSSRFVIDEDQNLTVDVSALISDVESDILSVALLSVTSGGTVTALSDTRFDFIPDENFFGNVTVTYSVTDGKLVSNASTIEFSVNAVNDAPVFWGGNSFLIDENATVVTTLVATDAENDVLTFSIVDDGQATLFEIGEHTGILSFVDAPDFERLNDQIYYDVQVAVSDGKNDITKLIEVAVLDVDEDNNVVLGTNDRDYLIGTDGNDRIVSKGGAIDRLKGFGGCDNFVFYDTFQDGVSERDYILDFDTAEDTITLSADAHFSVRFTSRYALITESNDGDRIYVYGNATNEDELNIMFESFEPIL